MIIACVYTYTHMKAEISSPQAHILQKQSQFEVYINFFFFMIFRISKTRVLEKPRKKKKEKEKIGELGRLKWNSSGGVYMP